MPYIHVSVFFLTVIHSLMMNDFDNVYTPVEKTLLQKDLNEEAFDILRNKCNICHATKKRVPIFTRESMLSAAPEIYQQVFVKKKMPKGRNVKLTENETLILKRWIDLVTQENELFKN